MIRLGDAERRRLAELRREARAITKPARDAAKKARKAESRAREQRRGKVEGQRQARERDSGFLAYLRRQPCEAAHLGGCAGPIHAAHIRYSDAARGSVNPGLQRKNHDRFANPLCEAHHLHDQHRGRERDFWDRVGKDAYETASRHYAAYSSDR